MGFVAFLYGLTGNGTLPVVVVTIQRSEVIATGQSPLIMTKIVLANDCHL